ncbi:DUF1549 and DUF1553 domain-containing protein [Limnoglobus roseus]|uniref:DUF1553 domain-containing protein n=1 Tax=Limnoglobus roseus TaxID=2598579 RepID=A0A5C1ADW4_9BACT|nr:DUF1549 and DUF1553 domain-containing protein [Limnoglobus roseus]QEL16900.1 hypothetical protein PX52LOC_03875 [Limnoglobus roseus]
MRRNSFLILTFLAGTALFSVSEIGVSAQVPNAKKALKQLAKAQAEAKKAEDAKKAQADAKKAEEAKRTTAAKKKSDSDDELAPLKPALIGGKKDTTAVAKFIDDQIAAKLAAEKMTASPTCTDEEFLRRTYVDISGVIPTAEQAKAFLADKTPGKRAKLIDDLLASPNFGQHQADIWMGLLVQRTSDSRRVDFGSLRTWLAEEFNANKSWDVIATDIVTATGEQEKNPAVGFYLSNNTVDKMTDELCKSFLGVQLQCAQCHDHKFNDWKQTEYWAMAQFFMKVQVAGLGKDAKPTVDEKPVVRRNKMNALPESAKMVEPKFLQGPSPSIGLKDPARPTLAKWMTGPTNPFFARAMVNRVWGELFGRGIVNPVDDMVGQNLPSHPEMLTGLAADFAANAFDVKHLVRSVCNSSAYQRSSKSTAGNEKAGPQLYATMAVKVLSPEQLFDSLAVVTKFDAKAGGPAARDKMVKGFAPAARDRFVNFFLAGAEMVSLTEYEAGIPQALKLMNSRQTAGGNPQAVRAVVGSSRGAEAIEKIYLATLSRFPTDAEKARLGEYVSKASLSQDGLADVLWAVLNSSEFTLNR